MTSRRSIALSIASRRRTAALRPCSAALWNQRRSRKNAISLLRRSGSPPSAPNWMCTMNDNMTQQMSKADRDRHRLQNLSRRRLLKGVRACIALPAFESCLRGRASAAAAQTAGQVAVTSTGAPLRTAFVYFPNGAIPANFWPTGDGKEYVLNKTMEPMADLREKMQVYGGLDQVNATPGPDGAGDHARASGTFLTSVRVKKTAGADIHAGVSIDQVMANNIGHMTRFPSLEFSCDAVRRSGNCDSGYSCAYQYNLSWQSPTTPVAPEPNPRLLFERLFGV